jgi:hypothetical protein
MGFKKGVCFLDKVKTNILKEENWGLAGKKVFCSLFPFLVCTSHVLSNILSLRDIHERGGIKISYIILSTVCTYPTALHISILCAILFSSLDPR